MKPERAKLALASTAAALDGFDEKGLDPTIAGTGAALNQPGEKDLDIAPARRGDEPDEPEIAANGTGNWI